MKEIKEFIEVDNEVQENPGQPQQARNNSRVTGTVREGCNPVKLKEC